MLFKNNKKIDTISSKEIEGTLDFGLIEYEEIEDADVMDMESYERSLQHKQQPLYGTSGSSGSSGTSGTSGNLLIYSGGTYYTKYN